MATHFTGDDRFRMAYAFAHGLAEDEVGSEHLLAGLVSAVPAIERLFDAFDLTTTVLHAVIRDRKDRWEGPDGLGPAGGGGIDDGGKPAPFSGAAKTALERCAPVASSEVVLLAILADEHSHAVTVLRDCGVVLDDLREPLRTARQPERVDPAAPDLRTTRDMLIGRQRYRGRGLRNLVLSFIVRVRINYAATPVLWASLEAGEIAKRRGAAPRTDDLLIALLATYEVAMAYPHLTRSVPGQYAGSRALAATGLDHRRLRQAAATHDLGTDAVAPKQLFKPGDTWPRDTAEMLRRLLTHPGNRSVRLLDILGVNAGELAR
ncbi:Clp protease N-terminal domain-containing protein [Actinoplanes sp. TFC3]|uniref:Clp protease N-terminal domain-containing protein n=1 Tax=Actinoplanes sp. TFC3 TaxID=1710355 RepID=UPI000833184F|nr:Clp protease N-terminal domain-containing protein [Actinoplanes sp. TFC3]